MGIAAVSRNSPGVGVPTRCWRYRSGWRIMVQDRKIEASCLMRLFSKDKIGAMAEALAP